MDGVHNCDHRSSMLLDLSIEMYPHYPEGVVILSHPPFVFYSIKASMYVEGVRVGACLVL